MRTVGIVGLGLIGGSMAKAIKEHTDVTLYGYNRTRRVTERAMEEGVIHRELTYENAKDLDLLILALMPEVVVPVINGYVPYLKKGCVIVDCTGIKSGICRELTGPLLKKGLFFVGGHPGLNCPLLEGEAYTDYQLTFEKPETADCMYPLESNPKLLDPANRRRVLNNEDVLKLNQNLFLNDGLVFDQIKSRSVTYSNPKTGKGVRLNFADFDYLVVWSQAKPSPFICIEPWMGFSTLGNEDDVFEHKQNVQFCKPGEERTFSFTLQIL